MVPMSLEQFAERNGRSPPGLRQTIHPVHFGRYVEEQMFRRLTYTATYVKSHNLSRTCVRLKTVTRNAAKLCVRSQICIRNIAFSLGTFASRVR